MKVWMIGAAALLLSACSSQPQKNYYQLPVPTATTSVVHAPVESGAHQLWLERVNVADFLSALGVVYQTNDVQFVTAGNNLWASPLEQQLQQTMGGQFERCYAGLDSISSAVRERAGHSEYQCHWLPRTL
jgi:uncharacterized protein